MPPPSTEYRDSAGVVIAASSRPQWTSGDQWQLDTVPFLTLSGSDPAFEFYRVVDATLLKDGRLVVLDAGSCQVRFFDKSGSFLYALGQKGEGPGDFQRLTSISPFRGDSLLVFDYWLRRATILTPSGALGRVLTLSGDLPAYELHPAGDSLLVAKAWSLSEFLEIEGPYRLRYLILTVTDGGEVLDTIADVAGWAAYKINREGGGYLDFAALFLVDGHIAVGRAGVYTGDAERMEFLRYSVGGELQRIVRVPVLDEVLTQDEIAAERAAMLRPEASAQTREVVPRLPAPLMRPAFGDLQLDEAGYLWVARYWSPRREADAPVLWYIFNPDGAWLGSVTTPARFSVLEIGTDYLLGTRRDDVDAEHVQLLRLTR